MNASRCDRFFSGLVDNGLTPSVSIAILKENELIYQFAYGRGKSGKESDFIVAENTRFNIGSVTKPVTGALIVKLAEMGELTLNEPVKAYIDEFNFGDITILNLMTHTAGFSNDLLHNISFPQEKEEVKGFLQSLYKIDRLAYNPGETFAYFSYGYCMLMDIIERITGRTLEDTAAEYIFKPALMEMTTFDRDKLKENTYVLPWDESSGRFLAETGFTVPSGDTGVFSTAADLVKFGNIFLNKGKAGERRIFPEAAADAMLRETTGGKFKKTPVFWMKTDTDIMGCFGDLNSHSTVGHTGFSGCMLFIDPQYATTAAILTNSTKLHGDWKNYKRICNVIMSIV